MTYVAARGKFDSVKTSSNDDAIQNLAEGLRLLTRGIEDDFTKVHREIKQIQNTLQSNRYGSIHE